jgi:hypothetical protein
MVGPRLTTLVVVTLAVVTVADGAAAQTRSCQGRVLKAREMIAEMHDEKDWYRAGNALVELADAAPTRCARMILPLLVTAMRDDEDVVRFYAAEAIGELGPPARTAIPALKAAAKLDKCVCWTSYRDCFKQNHSSTDAINEAVMELTGSPGDPALYDCALSGALQLRQDGEPAPRQTGGGR